MSNLHPIFEFVNSYGEPAETPDDEISRLDVVRYLEDEIAKVRVRLNPNGAFWHETHARLSALCQVLEHIEAMEAA